MKDDKKYQKIVNSRDIQRNFSVLKDALEEYDTVYISYYNKPFAKVTVDEKSEVVTKSNIEEFSGMFAKRNRGLKKYDYKSIYRKEMVKRHG